MRSLDQFERDLVKQIAGRSQGITLSDLVAECLKDVWIRLNVSDRKASVLIRKTDAVQDRQDEVYRKIICAVNLLELLKDEKYIIVAETLNAAQNLCVLGPDDPLTDMNNYPIRDNQVCNMLLKYVNRNIYSTQALEDYFNQKFKTDEEISHRKEYITTWIGIGVAVILGIFTIGLNLHTQNLYSQSVDAANRHAETAARNTEITNRHAEIATRNAETAIAGNKIRIVAELKRQERLLYEKTFKEPELMAFFADPLIGKEPPEITNHFIPLLLNQQEAKKWTSEYQKWGTVKNLVHTLYQPYDFHNPAKVKLRKAYDMGEHLLYLLQDVHGAYLAKQIDKAEFDIWVPYIDDFTPNPLFLSALCFGHSSGYISRDFAQFVKKRIEEKELNYKIVEVVYPDILKADWVDRVGQRDYEKFLETAK